MSIWSIIFLFLAVTAGLLGLTGISGVASQLAWIMCVFGLLLAVLFAVLARRLP